MTHIRRLLCAVLPLAVSACASSPPVRYFSLDDGRPTAVGSPTGLRIAVTQVNLPDLVDRPQLVVRTAGHQLRFSDQDEWAEPLRRQIPRVIARDLGEDLDSGRIVALPFDAQDFDPDFKVMLDIQRLDVISGQGVDLDVVWRVEPRDGNTVFGRSLVWETIDTTAEPGGYQAAVAAESRAFRGVAANIAAGIADRVNNAASDGFSTDRHPGPAEPRDDEERCNGI
jgi:uncharacterized lipoprotein YmbA